MGGLVSALMGGATKPFEGTLTPSDEFEDSQGIADSVPLAGKGGMKIRFNPHTIGRTGMQIRVTTGPEDKLLATLHVRGYSMDSTSEAPGGFKKPTRVVDASGKLVAILLTTKENAPSSGYRNGEFVCYATKQRGFSTPAKEFSPLFTRKYLEEDTVLYPWVQLEQNRRRRRRRH